MSDAICVANKAIVSRVSSNPDTFDLLQHIGAKVEATFKGGSSWYPGKIHEVNTDGTAVVHFDDGDKDSNVPASCIRMPGAFAVGGEEATNFAAALAASLPEQKVTDEEIDNLVLKFNSLWCGRYDSTPSDLKAELRCLSKVIVQLVFVVSYSSTENIVVGHRNHRVAN
jgi:hypothetical protein